MIHNKAYPVNFISIIVYKSPNDGDAKAPPANPVSPGPPTLLTGWADANFIWMGVPQ